VQYGNNPKNPASVVLIDRRGILYWSTTGDAEESKKTHFCNHIPLPLASASDKMGAETMTMVKFKKGDRVIVLSTPDTPYAGKTGVITGD
jgi:hypothetical protein